MITIKLADDRSNYFISYVPTGESVERVLENIRAEIEKYREDAIIFREDFLRDLGATQEEVESGIVLLMQMYDDSIARGLAEFEAAIRRGTGRELH